MLNASYEPLQVVSWQKAFVLWYQGKVDVLEHHNNAIVRSFQAAFKVPSVIRLKTYVRLNFQKKIRFSRENVYRRDEFTCQYCDKVHAARELTLDHVFPVSKGGEKSWTNIVTACKSCNQKKGDKTPQQAGMPLKSPPREPGWLPTLHLEIKIQTAPESWRDYLFFSSPDTSFV